MRNNYVILIISKCFRYDICLSESFKPHSQEEKSVKKGISLQKDLCSSLCFGLLSPYLGALILQAAYGAVDLLIVGKLRKMPRVFPAVGTGSSFMQMATFIITSLAMGSTVIIGHHIGEQKIQKKQEMRSELRSFFF